MADRADSRCDLFGKNRFLQKTTGAGWVYSGFRRPCSHNSGPQTLLGGASYMDILKKAIAPVPYEIFERLQLAHRGPKLPKLRRAGVRDRRQTSGQRIYSWNNKLFQTKVRARGRADRALRPLARVGRPSQSTKFRKAGANLNRETGAVCEAAPAQTGHFKIH